MIFYIGIPNLLKNPASGFLFYLVSLPVPTACDWGQVGSLLTLHATSVSSCPCSPSPLPSIMSGKVFYSFCIVFGSVAIYFYSEW